MRFRTFTLRVFKYFMPKGHTVILGWFGAASESITVGCVPKVVYYCAVYSIQGVLRGKINILAQVVMPL